MYILASLYLSVYPSACKSLKITEEIIMSSTKICQSSALSSEI
jgi:hypothetical protein